MRVEPVSTFADLAFHGLAHVPLRGPESLHDPRYVAGCAASMEPSAREPLASDGPAIGAHIDAVGAGLAIQWLPRLHRDAESFARSAPLELSELREDHGCDAHALGILQATDQVTVEWLRADLLLSQQAFLRARTELDGLVRAACAEIAALLGSVRSVARPDRVGVALALGSRGRGFGDGVVVGVPAPWNGLDAATPAVLALHEHAVVGATGDHTRREWTALTSVARGLVDAAGPLRIAHARWLASLDLDALSRDAERARLVEPEHAALMRASPRDRASLLGAIAFPRQQKS